MSLHHDPAPDNAPRKKTRRTIAELIRNRHFVDGEMFDRDLVIALADHEEVLLRRCPHLAGWTRTESALPGLLIFIPPSVESPGFARQSPESAKPEVSDEERRLLWLLRLLKLDVDAVATALLKSSGHQVKTPPVVPGWCGYRAHFGLN